MSLDSVLRRTRPQAAHPGRQINFQAFRVRASKGPVIGKHYMATLLADQSSIGQNRRGMELVIDNAIGTTRFFFFHYFEAQNAA